MKTSANKLAIVLEVSKRSAGDIIDLFDVHDSERNYMAVSFFFFLHNHFFRFVLTVPLMILNAFIEQEMNHVNLK